MRRSDGILICHLTGTVYRKNFTWKLGELYIPQLRKIPVVPSRRVFAEEVSIPSPRRDLSQRPDVGDRKRDHGEMNFAGGAQSKIDDQRKNRSRTKCIPLVTVKYYSVGPGHPVQKSGSSKARQAGA